jgi:hypothetical protein
MATAFVFTDRFVPGTALSATPLVPPFRRIQIRVLIHPFHLYHPIMHKIDPMTAAACAQTTIVMKCGLSSSDTLDLSLLLDNRYGSSCRDLREQLANFDPHSLRFENMRDRH